MVRALDMLTEHGCLSKSGLEDSIGLGWQTTDCYRTQRYATSKIFVSNERNAAVTIR